MRVIILPASLRKTLWWIRCWAAAGTFAANDNSSTRELAERGGML